MATTPGMDFPGVGTGLVVLNNNKILLCKRLKAPEALHCSIPGGKVDLAEHSSQAAIRETFEETGLIVTDVRFLCLSEHIISNDQQHWLSPIYLAESYRGDISLNEPDKIATIGWFDLNSLPSPLSLFAKDAIYALQSS